MNEDAGQKTDIGPVTALVGDDDFGKRHALEALRARFLARSESDEVQLDGAAGDPDELGRTVVEELRTRPLGGEQKLVVVTQADEFVKKKKDLVLGFLDAPVDFSRLVLVARSFGGGRNKLRDRLKQAKAYREFSRPADTIAPWERRRRPGDTDLNRWVEERARSIKLCLGRGVAAGLTARIGSNLGELDAILRRWEMMLGPGETVDLARVETLGPRHREVDSFAVADAVLARDPDLALDALTCLFEEGLVLGGRRLLKPRDMLAPLLGLLLKRLRLTARARRLLATGAGPEQLTKDLGVRPFLVDRTVEDARRFEERELLFGIRRLLDADRDFKFRRQEGREVLVDLVLDLVRGGPAPYPVRI